MKLNAWGSSSRQASSDKAGISSKLKSIISQSANHRADKHHYSSSDWHHEQSGKTITKQANIIKRGWHRQIDIIKQGGLDQVDKHHRVGWASPSSQALLSRRTYQKQISITNQVRHRADWQTSSSGAGIVIEQGGLDQVDKHHRAGWASPSSQTLLSRWAYQKQISIIN